MGHEYKGLFFDWIPFTLRLLRVRAARGRGVDVSNSAWTDTRMVRPARDDLMLPPNVSRFNGI